MDAALAAYLSVGPTSGALVMDREEPRLTTLLSDFMLILGPLALLLKLIGYIYAGRLLADAYGTTANVVVFGVARVFLGLAGGIALSQVPGITEPNWYLGLAAVRFLTWAGLIAFTFGSRGPIPWAVARYAAAGTIWSYILDFPLYLVGINMVMRSC